MRMLFLIAAAALPLAACGTMGGETARNTSANKAVSAVVNDESKRQEAAATAEATGSSAAGVAAVTEGPKDQKPVPN